MKDKRYWLTMVAMLFLGMFYMVSSTGKLFLQSTSVEYPLFLELLLPVGLAQTLAYSLPYIELGIGVLLIMGIGIKLAASASALLIMGYLLSNAVMIQWGYGASPCGCFGMNGSLTVYGSLTIDIIMGILTVTILASYRGAYFNCIPLILTEGHTTRARYSPVR